MASRWIDRLTRQPQSRVESEAMRRANNPAVIPRNHRVEAALAAAVEDNDLGVMERLPDVLQSSFDHERVAATSEYRNPRPQAALYIAPFAGPEP